MKLLKAIITCRALKNGVLNVKRCGSYATYNLFKDHSYLKYRKARDRIAGHSFLNRLLKRFV